jgi:hypothetical protein
MKDNNKFDEFSFLILGNLYNNKIKNQKMIPNNVNVFVSYMLAFKVEIK